MEVIIFICIFLYFIFGVGMTRAISKLKGRDIHVMEILFWPMALVVFACFGDIS